MIDITKPSMTVAVTRMTGIPPVSALAAGRPATRDAMTRSPAGVRL
jgi:hypothetical protein